ncbi:hypothetical protein ACN38_g4737, partial [Penicillium nordicum]
ETAPQSNVPPTTTALALDLPNRRDRLLQLY